MVCLLLAGLLLLVVFALQPSGGREPSTTGGSVSGILEQLQADPRDWPSYQEVITFYLEQGRMDSAYRYAETMLLSGGVEYGSWCVECFLTFDRRDLATKAALLSDALTGEALLFSQVSAFTVEELIPDSPLRQAVELFFGRTANQITLDQLQEITYLSVGGEDVRTGGRTIVVGREPEGEAQGAVALQVEAGESADGLGLLYFQGLRRLEVWERGVETEELVLPRLTGLTLSWTQMEDLTSLSALSNLEELYIIGTNFQSLAGVDALPSLTALTLENTGLKDLSVLPAQEGLTRLGLLDNESLAGVASLAQMDQLTELTLTGEALSDLSPLSGLTGLRHLTVTDTAILSTSFLAGLTGLEELTFLDNDQISSVPELSSLTGLTRLTLDSDELFADSSDLYALSSLRELELQSTKSLSYLLPLSQLEELTVYFTRSEADLSPLAGFSNLRRLSFRPSDPFYENYSTDLTGLNALQSLPLEELDLGGETLYRAIDPVVSIGTLQVLDLSGVSAEGTDFSLFSRLGQLRELNLSGFRDMLDLPPGPGELYWSYEPGPASAFVEQLGALERLERLDLSDCGVEDISALSGLTGLTWLDLSGNRITDLSPLAGLEGLTYLNLSGNPIGDFSSVEGREGLVLIR